MSHHHDHDHGHDDEHADAHNHIHDHSDDITPALQNLLYEQVDFSKLVTLNEEESNSGRAICQKTWAERMELEPELKSSADEQLLMIVPYAMPRSTCRRRAVLILLIQIYRASAPALDSNSHNAHALLPQDAEDLRQPLRLTRLRSRVRLNPHAGPVRLADRRDPGDPRQARTL